VERLNNRMSNESTLERVQRLMQEACRAEELSPVRRIHRCLQPLEACTRDLGTGAPTSAKRPLLAGPSLPWSFPRLMYRTDSDLHAAATLPSIP